MSDPPPNLLMKAYHIVDFGAAPNSHASTNLGGTCAAWADSPNKARTEVIEVDMSTGKVLRRLSFEEAERIAHSFKHPKYAES